jgi:hypothetical protein
MKTHAFDGVSFFSGLVIAAIGLLYLIPNTPSDIIDAMSRLGNWFWPLLLLAGGVAVLVPALMSRKDANDSEN